MRDDSEIEEDRACGRRDQHVRRLEIAMQLAGAVDREHAFRHLAEHVPQSRNVECGSAHGAEEIHALDELHRVEPLVTLDDELIETHQVRVGHVGEHAEFLLEARDRVGTGVEQRLQRYQLPALPVEGGKDDAHAAGPEFALEPKSRCALKVDVDVSGADAAGRGRRGMRALVNGGIHRAALTAEIRAVRQPGSARRAELDRPTHLRRLWRAVARTAAIPPHPGHCRQPPASAPRTHRRRRRCA